MKLEGRTAFITGAGSGMGLATAELFATEGATVYGADISADTLAGDFADRVPGGIAIPLDVADSTAVNGAFDRVARESGRLHALVNAAGVNTPNRASGEKLNETNMKVFTAAAAGERFHPEFTEDTTDEDFERVMRINLFGPFFTTRAAIPLLKAAGEAAIVNFSSAAAVSSIAMPPYYPASKAGLLGLTRTHAAELAPFGIRVNSLAPGAVDTPLFRQADEDMVQALISMQPIARAARPEEIAQTVLFLVSEDAAYYTGHMFSPSGGMVTP